MYARYSVLAAQVLSNPLEFRQACRDPLLVWHAPEGEARPTDELVWATQAGQGGSRPVTRDPVVLAVRKGRHPTNAFGMGITVGRTGNNDIVIDDPTVSRFHCYFEQHPSTGRWRVVDAESQNGTFVGGHRLAPSRAFELSDRCELRVGDAQLTFYLPGAFEQHVADGRARRP